MDQLNNGIHEYWWNHSIVLWSPFSLSKSVLQTIELFIHYKVFLIDQVQLESPGAVVERQQAERVRGSVHTRADHPGLTAPTGSQVRCRRRQHLWDVFKTHNPTGIVQNLQPHKYKTRNPTSTKLTTPLKQNSQPHRYSLKLMISSTRSPVFSLFIFCFIKCQ